MPTYRIVMWAVFVLSIGLAMAGIGKTLIQHNRPGAPASSGPMTVEQGGSVQLRGTSETATVTCNQGNIALDGIHSTYTVTGHCASIRVGGYSNNVTVENADTLMSSGYANTVTDHACNGCDITVSSYNNIFDVTGHAASLKISSYSNKVTIDNVDSITVAGYQNTVTYHSGSPKTTDSGYSNTIRQG